MYLLLYTQTFPCLFANYYLAYALLNQNNFSFNAQLLDPLTLMSYLQLQLLLKLAQPCVVVLEQGEI